MTTVLAQQPPCGVGNPAAGNTCADAPLICNLDGYCGTTSSTYTNDMWGNKTTSAFSIGTGLLGGFTNVSGNNGCGTGATIENNSFLKFVAGSSTVNLGLWVGNCQNANWMSGVQVHVFKLIDICGQGNVTNIYCKNQFSPTPGGSQNIPLTGLTPGETYYIMVDGYEADVCDYTFTATSGISVGVTADINQNTSLCAGESVIVKASGGSGNYTWSGDAGLSSTTGTTVTVTPPSTPGTYNYKITSTGGGSCGTSSDYDFSITVTPGGGTPTFNQLGPFCTGASFTLPTTSSNTITGTWTPAINNTQTTIYTFTPAVGSTCSPSSTTMEVVISGQVTPSFTNPGPVCAGETFTLPTTSNNSITGTWSPAVNSTQTTTYTFTPSAGQSCASSTTMEVVIKDKETAIFTNPGPICTGSTFTLPTTSINNFTGTWSPAVNSAQTTTYTFAPTAGQCVASTQMTVAVENNITPTFTTPDPMCEGTAFTLPTTSNNAATGTWSPVVNTNQTTTYTFTPTPSQGGCEFLNTTITVTILPLPTVSFTANPEIGSSLLEVTFTNTSTNSTSYSWNFGNGQSSQSVNPTTTYTNTGDYIVILTASNGVCSNDAETTITVLDWPTIVINPTNVFTPNGDGKNDDFFIETQNAKTVYVEIFNRWGNLMTKLEKLTDKWDGGNANDGVYFYKYKITDLSDTIFEGHGFFHLLRQK